MKVVRSAVSVLPKLTFRFGFLALVLVAASIACHAATPLPTIAYVSGKSQYTPYSSTFAKPLVAQVIDPSSKLPIAGVQVNFPAVPGLQLSANSVITDANGQVSVTATGLAVGGYTVTAQVAINPGSKALFTGLGVSRVVLTIVPGNMQSIVGVIPAFHNYTLTGFVNSETAATANITGAPTFTTTATPTSVARTYGITAAVGTLSAPNYSFVGGKSLLTLTGVPVCGNIGPNQSSLLTGTYAFNLFDQQRGYTGVFTTDGSSMIQGQAFYNVATESNAQQWNFAGNYRVGNGYRGGADLLQTSAVNSTITMVTSFCLAMDSVTSGIASSGHLIEIQNYQSSKAGSLYRFDGSATSVASFNGTYIVGLQGTRIDTNTGNPLQYAQTAALNLDGNGNVTGSYVDVDYLQANGGTPNEQYNGTQPVTGTYTFDPAHNTGVITLSDGTTTTNLYFVAPTSSHLLVMTRDAGATQDGASSAPVYFGEAQRQAAGPFSTASVKGNINFLAQGIDAYSGSYTPAITGSGTSNGLVGGVIPADTVTGGEGLVVQAGGMSFDGAGSMTRQGNFTLVDGLNANVLIPSNGALSYTIDPVTGRFESRDPSTNACTLCGYLVAPNKVVALAPGSGVPLFATLQPVTIVPSTLKVNSLSGNYSIGTVSMISPLSSPLGGRLTFDGKGNFNSAIDTDGPVYGPVFNLPSTGTYTPVNGGFALTGTGATAPDFYLYLNSRNQAILVPYSTDETPTSPLLTLSSWIP